MSSKLSLFVVQICHHFHERTQRTLEGRWSRAAVHFLNIKCLHCDFENGSQNQHFQTYYFGSKGGGHNVDTSGRPFIFPRI